MCVSYTEIFAICSPSKSFLDRCLFPTQNQYPQLRNLIEHTSGRLGPMIIMSPVRLYQNQLRILQHLTTATATICIVHGFIRKGVRIAQSANVLLGWSNIDAEKQRIQDVHQHQENLKLARAGKKRRQERVIGMKHYC